MTTYTDVFGGANIYPSEISYSASTLATSMVLHWPTESASTGPFATRIMDVTSADSYTITLPSAEGAGVGETILFNNISATAFSVLDATGTQVTSVAAGSAWQVYLTDNTTAAGVWRSFQYGASLAAANASALAGTGIIAVGAVLSQSVPITSFNSNYAAGAADRARMFVWSGASGTMALPSPSTVSNNWFTMANNAGSGALTLDPVGTELIDGSSSLSLQPGESCIIVSDGANYYTLGRGRAAVFAFDYTSISVAGLGTKTLGGAELNRIAYSFTGVLTGNKTVVVPTTVQQYWVSNSTTGAFTLTVKTALGSGVAIVQNGRAILYCDGANVVNASTAGIAVPIGIVDGGTGATSAGGARINLGATSIGDAVFTAASTAAAYAALGVVPTISGGTF